MIKYIIFDLGGVVANNAVRTARKIIGKKLKMDFESFWNNEIKRYWEELKTGRIDEEYFWKKVKEKLKNKGKEFDEKEFMKAFYKYQRKNKNVEKIIANLKKKGYKTAILSNGVARWIEKWRGYLKKYFDFIVMSNEIGYAKPNRKAYEILLKKMNAKPEECVFIDDKEKNLKTAELIKMKTILFKNSKQLEKELKSILQPG
ncbi:MAG: HAD family phosphatase [Candidatus Aenigmatarchaeota archaeon]